MLVAAKNSPQGLKAMLGILWVIPSILILFYSSAILLELLRMFEISHKDIIFEFEPTAT